jgi:Secretion system C-terminal sorting domain
MKKLLLFVAFLLVGMMGAYAQSAAKVDISVYPNPATEFIQVRDQSATAGNIAIFNLTGRKVRSFEYSEGQQYLVADLPKGMYLVQISDRAGDVITTQKMTKR